MAQYILILMADEIVLDGKSYVPSKRAAVSCGYAQDYVGQLARSGAIDAQRVGGLWYVSMESLESYKRSSDAFVPQVPQAPKAMQELDTIVSFDGKDYVSASKASKLTGYNPDYVGQLARAGKVLSRQIGNRWYVERESLMAHKSQKDALLASVQSEAAGLVRPQIAPQPKAEEVFDDSAPRLTYIREDRELLPTLIKPEIKAEERIESVFSPLQPEKQSVPIRIVPSERNLNDSDRANAPKRVKKARKVLPGAVRAVAALTVVIVVSYGFTTLKSDSVYAVLDASKIDSMDTMLGAAASAYERVLSAIENLVTDELHYSR